MNLDALALDALAEIVNIGSGRAAAALSELTGERIELSSSVTVCNIAGLTAALSQSKEPVETAVIQDFSGGLGGRALLAFPRASGVVLAKLISGISCPGNELDEDLTGVLEEVGNIVLNSVLGTMSNEANVDLQYSVPKLSIGQQIDSKILSKTPGVLPDELQLVLADTRFRVVNGGITGSLILVFEFGSLQKMLEAVLDRATCS